MKYQYWKCTICKEEFRIFTQMGFIDVLQHLKKHKKEYAEMKKANSDYYSEDAKSEERFIKRSLGFWIKNITPPIVKRKPWKCPGCGEEFPYISKKWHIDNYHNIACHRTFLGEMPKKSGETKKLT